MRIIACSAGYNDRFAAFYYSFDKRFLNGLIRLGNSVVHLSDRDAARIALGIPKLGPYFAARQLMAVAEAYKPHLILLFHANKIPNSTLLHIRERDPSCRIIDVDCDLLDMPQYMHRALERGKHVHATLVTSAGASLARLRGAGLRAGYVPNPVDFSLDEATPHSGERPWDLVYLASAKPSHPRWDFMKALVAKTPDLKIGLFGAGRERILGHDYYELLGQSKAGLNWSYSNSVDLYSSDRIAQLFGAGVCVCMPRSSGFERFISNHEALYFKAPDDLATALRAAVRSDSWMERATAGRARYHALFNERRVARYVVDFAHENSLSDYEWGSL